MLKLAIFMGSSNLIYMEHATANLCDEYIDKLQVAEPVFINIGGKSCFEGEIHTLKVFEDNSLVRAALEKKRARKSSSC